jgi:hypothetical protein
MRRNLALHAASALLGLSAIIAALAAVPASAATRACTSSQTQVWLGDGEGGGAAGSVYYPLELSNVGHASCTLYGYPGVSAWGQNGVQEGPAALRSGGAHSVVTLRPNGTAHAILRIADYGAICNSAVSALGLKVYPPGERQSFMIEFPFEVCASRAVLTVEPVRAGVGIPGYTSS